MIRVATFFLLALSGCISAQGAADFDGRYRLLTIDGAAIPGTADMTIAGNDVRGEGPCNGYWTSNAARWPEVSLSPIATTRRQCFVEGGETAFLAALQQATRIEPVKGGLEVSGPTHRMRFAVQP